MRIRVKTLSSNFMNDGEFEFNTFVAELNEAREVFPSHIKVKVILELNYDGCYYEGERPDIDVFLEGESQ